MRPGCRLARIEESGDSEEMEEEREHLLGAGKPGGEGAGGATYGGRRGSGSCRVGPPPDGGTAARERSLRRAIKRRQRHAQAAIAQHRLGCLSSLCGARDQSCVVAYCCCPEALLAAGLLPPLPEPEWSQVAGSETLGRIEQLLVLADRSKLAFDGGDQAHLDALAALWSEAMLPEAADCAFPDDKTKQPPWRSEMWKSLGFQGSDPTTDLRGGGVLALEGALCLFRRFPATAAGMRAEDLLCCATSVNVTQMLLVHLRIFHVEPRDARARLQIDPSAKPRRAGELHGPAPASRRDLSLWHAVQADAMRGFLNLCEGCASPQGVVNVFSVVAGAAMVLVLAAWRELCAREPAVSLLDFPLVLYSARVRIVTLLASGPESLRALESWATNVPTVLVDTADGPP